MSRQASGFRAWMLQRISAVYLGVYFIYMLVYFTWSPPADFMAWQAWFKHPVNSVSLMLFFVAILIHAWVGVRDVVIDYVHPLMIRVAVLTITALCLIGSGLWVARVVFLASAGGIGPAA